MNIEENKKTNKEEEEKEKKQKIRNELVARFLVNLPASEQSDWNRLLYHALHAMWFYKDNCCTSPSPAPIDQTKRVKRRRRRRGQQQPQPLDDTDVKDLHAFCQWFFTTPLTPSYEQVHDFFYDYYYKIPVCGAVVIDRKHHKWLVVKGARSENFSFPRGKIDAGETDVACAIREVHEETGLNISTYINPHKFVDVWNKEKRIRLFFAEIHESLDLATSSKTPPPSVEINEVTWKDIPQYHSNDTINYIHRMYRDVYTYESRLAFLKICRWLP